MPHELEILLIEDSDTDAEMTCRAFHSCVPRPRLNRVCNGLEALQYLRQEGEYGQERLPDLVLLDLNMPQIDGREVLKQIRSTPSTKTLPVIVLTTSASQVDVQLSYELNANAYVVKPIDFDELIVMIKKLNDFWATVAKLPHS
jgi:two-component system, chemotaxis family, response regulator Rcp1